MSTDELTPGKVVNIYEDPVTCRRFEGEATLLDSHRPDDGDGLSLWTVKFLDDGHKVFRIVNKTTANPR